MPAKDPYAPITTIQVTVKLREKLKALGKKGDTYEDILWRLIEDNSSKK